MNAVQPIDIISRGLGINPLLTKLAFGIPIVLACVALAVSLFTDPTSAAYAFVAGFVACVLLVILSQLAINAEGTDWLVPIVKTITWFCAVLFMATCTVIFASWATGKPFAATLSGLVGSSRTASANSTLVGGVDVDAVPSANFAVIAKSELDEFAARVRLATDEAPALHLKAATLSIGRPLPADRVAVIYGNELSLEGSSRVVTGGNNVALIGKRVQFGIGSVVENPTPSSSAGPAQNGQSSGDVFVYALERVDGSLQVLLPGQDGGPGLDGAAGANGLSGAHGDNAASGLFDCQRGAGRGGDGQPGGDGLPGGVGGNGGNGGNVYFAAPETFEQFQGISVVSPGGRGGPGGAGGSGGLGGKGGDGGSPVGLCSGGGPRGTDAPNGSPGSPGARGADGKPGVLQRKKI